MFQSIKNFKLSIKFQVVIFFSLISLLVPAGYLISMLQSHNKLNLVAMIKERGVQTAENSLDTLNMMMLTGVISDHANRTLYYKKTALQDDVKNFYVFRTSTVNSEFDKGMPSESLRDALDKQSINTKQIIVDLNHNTLRVTVPFIAKKDYKGTNCLQCHKVEEGTVLGGVTLDIDISKEVNQAEGQTYWLWIAFIVFQIIIQFIIFFMVRKVIIIPLSKFRDGLLSFFNFLHQKTDKTEIINIDTKDEFGEMAKVINEDIADFEKKFAEQNQSLIDFERVCNDASKGFLFHRAKTNYSDTSLNRLSMSLNTMLDQIELAFSGVNQVLIGFAQGNYASTTANKSVKGSFASVDQAMLSASTANSEIFGMLTQFSREFNQNAIVLSESGEELSTSANEQAASLEETAAAIEQLTSNVSANVGKTDEMTRVAQEAKAAAEQGNTIANESLSAMNEIVSATEAINQAVDVIDNIAFQTNILSLNAAVEAATAGDAGKGFAVVAQEVRNLANRSAEAAKQIQDLARTARIKSQNGLETSRNMMDGFTLISTKIEQTDSMVRDVASASREQMAGISQINDAVAQLDQMTQNNAKTAENVAEISNNILIKTERFEQILSRITFDATLEKQNCDINMSFETAKLKMDHVNFKENTYKKLKDSTSTWKVTSHHDCNLGKWIDAHANEPFAKTAEWNELLAVHEKVHNGTQAFIDADMSQQSLDYISAQLEEATVGVFKGIDNLKRIHCSHVPLT